MSQVFCCSQASEGMKQTGRGPSSQRWSRLRPLSVSFCLWVGEERREHGQHYHAVLSERILSCCFVFQHRSWARKEMDVRTKRKHLTNRSYKKYVLPCICESEFTNMSVLFVILVTFLPNVPFSLKALKEKKLQSGLLTLWHISSPEVIWIIKSLSVPHTQKIRGRLTDTSQLFSWAVCDVMFCPLGS